MHVDKELAICLETIGYKCDRTPLRDTSDDWEDPSRFNHDPGGHIICPELNTVIDYLRDAHGLHCYTKVSEKYWAHSITDLSGKELGYSHYYYPTHREALTAAAKKATEIVKERIDNGKK